MIEKVSSLSENAIKNIDKCETIKEVENLRIKYLGKKGEVTGLLKNISSLSEEDKPIIGGKINILKKNITEQINKKKTELNNRNLEDSLNKDYIDISLDGREPKFGKYHPISLIINKMLNIFTKFGFTYIEAPELETEYYNFDALNIPPTHPARDDQDSFYIKDHILLRTQTSPAQIRVMEKNKPPIAVVHPGRTYRRDTLDSTHLHTFHQVEGLLVDKGVSFANLKGTVEMFVHELLGKTVETRFRPSYFPFTEPSAELDVKFKTKRGERWMELGGLGMVDPEVFKYANIDPDIYSGWAFGLGIERFAMVKYEIPDIRMFYENDIRFIDQF